MKGLFQKFSDWLFSISEPGKQLKHQRDGLLTLVAEIRGQYKKFLILSPRVQQNMNDIVDELNGSLGVSGMKIFEDYTGSSFRDDYLLPPGDYARAVESNDILRQANERLNLSNEDLRLSNNRLLREIEELKSRAGRENRIEPA